MNRFDLDFKIGLNCSHGAWDGAYSAFMRWRIKIAQVAGMPPLELMEGFYTPLKGGHKYDLPTFYTGLAENPHRLEQMDESLPIKWQSLKRDKLHILLTHSDCEGSIPSRQCAGLADRLEQLIELLPDEEDSGHIGNWRVKTQTFVNGLRAAAAAKESLKFR